MHRLVLEQQIVVENVNHKVILTKLMALAWLPHGAIPPTLNIIRNAVEAGEFGPMFAGLLAWFDRTLIRGLDPLLWSCFGKDHMYTNWPAHVPQLLINETFPGARVPTRMVGFFKFYGKSFCFM